MDERETSSNWIARYMDLQVRTTILGFKMLLIVGPILLALVAYYLFAPWEVAYRQHGATVLRAQVVALPPYDTDRMQQISSFSQVEVSVRADYSRNGFCAPVLDYYRQIAPVHGWTYTQTVQTSSHTPANNIDTTDTTDYYSGVFEGYSAELEVDCDLSSLGYEITATGPSLCLWSCPTALRTGASPDA